MIAEGWATLIIASIGALTGALALGAQVWSFVAAGPRVKVTLTAALPTANPAWVIGLDVTNIGRMPVEILEVGVMLGRDEDKKVPVHSLQRAFWQGPNLPFRLLDGAQASWYVEPAVIALAAQQHAAANKVGGYARLGTGKVVITKRDNVQDAVTLHNSNQS